jgi:hypothetical protein
LSKSKFLNRFSLLQMLNDEIDRIDDTTHTIEGITGESTTYIMKTAGECTTHTMEETAGECTIHTMERIAAEGTIRSLEWSI